MGVLPNLHRHLPHLHLLLQKRHRRPFLTTDLERAKQAELSFLVEGEVLWRRLGQGGWLVCAGMDPLWAGEEKGDEELPEAEKNLENEKETKTTILCGWQKVEKRNIPHLAT